MIQYRRKIAANELVSGYRLIALKVVSIGDLVERQELEEFPEIAVIKKLHKPVEFLPFRVVSLEDGQKMPMLETELQDIKLGDHVYYDVRQDGYVKFNEELFENDPRLEKVIE